MTFSDWLPLTEDEIGHIPEGIAGAYEIRVVEERGKARVINRFFGCDEEGIIDIGESGNLQNRLWEFWGRASGKRKYSHMAGWRYSYLGLNNKDKCPIEKLEFRWASTGAGKEGKAEARALESELMGEYVRKHSELPPLNYSYNWTK